MMVMHALLLLLCFLGDIAVDVRGSLYKGASLGGPGGERFDDVTTLGLLNKDYVFRVNSLLLWGADNERFPAFEASYLVLDGVISGVQWPAKHNILNYPGSAPRYTINIETGDVIEKMFGYFSSDPSLHRGLFILNAVGFDIRKADGTLQTYTVGNKVGEYQSILGPIVGFWGGLGGAFDQLGVYIDPAWWPSRPTRMLKTDLHGRLLSESDWNYFDDVIAMQTPFVVRMSSIIVSFNNSAIYGLSVAYQVNSTSTININHGSNPPNATTISIDLPGDQYVGELEVEWGTEYHSGVLQDCLGYMKITVFSGDGHKLSYSFGEETTSKFVTSNPVVAFHGVSTATCLRRIGGYILLPGEEFSQACLLPEPPKNGYIVGMPDVVGEGTAIFFDCNTGYKLSQGSYVVCKANGFWEGDSPICVRGETTDANIQGPESPSTGKQAENYFNPLTIFLLVAVIVLLVVLVALSICSIVVCVHSTRKSGDHSASVHYTSSMLDTYDGSLFNPEEDRKHATVTNPIYEYSPQGAEFKQ